MGALKTVVKSLCISEYEQQAVGGQEGTAAEHIHIDTCHCGLEAKRQ